jgi:glycine/D-amino acid oxidase-like deaminating enzyme
MRWRQVQTNLARTSAHLVPLCDDLMSEMQKIRGEDQSKLFYESQNAAVDRIEEIQKREGIDCDFRRLDGYLFQGDDMPADVIDEELDAVGAVGAPVDRLVKWTVVQQGMNGDNKQARRYHWLRGPEELRRQTA